MKAQLIVEEESEQITGTFFGKGRMHDYKLFQLSRVKLGKHLKLRADLGYWGLANAIGECDSAAEKQQTASIEQSGKEGESGVGKKANQGGKRDSAAEDISDIERTLSPPSETIWFEIQFDSRSS